MSVTALRSRDARRPTWPQTLVAVLGGSVLAWTLTVVWMLPLGSLGLFPMYAGDAAVGYGWPWRIDGPWAFAANLGPLLLGGVAFAWSFQLLLGRFGDAVDHPSVVLALVTAILLPSKAGLLGLAILIVIARHEALRERLRLTRRGKVLLAVAGLILTVVTISYGITHPLTASADPSSGDDTMLPVVLRNDGRFDARVHAVEVPGSGVTRVDMRIAGGEAEFVRLALARSGCGATVESVRVRMTVAGREMRRTVWLDQPVGRSC